MTEQTNSYPEKFDAEDQEVAIESHEGTGPGTDDFESIEMDAEQERRAAARAETDAARARHEAQVAAAEQPEEVSAAEYPEPGVPEEVVPEAPQEDKA